MHQRGLFTNNPFCFSDLIYKVCPSDIDVWLGQAVDDEDVAYAFDDVACMVSVCVYVLCVCVYVCM